MTDCERKKGSTALLVALAAGDTVRDAAAMAGVSEATAYRRLRSKKFRGLVSRFRSQYVSEAAGRLAKLATRATDALEQLLASQSDSIRLGAARAVLQELLRVRDATELAERLDDLEKLVKNKEETDERY